MKTVLLIQGGGCSPQTKKLRGELCCQREKEVEEKTEQPERESSQTAKGNYLFIYCYYLLFLWIWGLGDRFWGLQLWALEFMGLIRFLGDNKVCLVVSRIHGCWRTNPTFGLQLHKCRSSCYSRLFLLLYIRGHVDQDQTKVKN